MHPTTDPTGGTDAFGGTSPETDPDLVEVGWLIDGFDPANPFTASIVFTDGRHDIWADLNPQALAHLHDALGEVRAAQRAAILGTPAEAQPLTDPDNAPETGDAPPVSSDASRPRRFNRKTVIMSIMGGLVGLSVLYSLAAGAVLI